MRKRKRNNKSWLAVAFIIVLAGGCFLFAKNIIGDKETSELSPVYPTSSANMQHYPNLFKDVKSKTSNNKITDYTGFSLSFNSRNHTPDWVGWELLASETSGQAVRKGKKFWQDEKVAGCAMYKDYTRSGYDRGHMYPAADAKWSEKSMNECFAMTNICPQNQSLNSGAWSTLEEKERTWAKRDSALIIIAGPMYEASDTKTIGDTRVRVPSAFFKVIIAPYISQPRGIAFIYPNMPSPGNMQNYVVTIDQVEEITGLDFFSSLPDNLENEIESKSSFKLWERKR